MRIFELAQLFHFQPESVIQTLQSLGLERYTKQPIDPMTDLDDEARMMIQDRLLGERSPYPNRAVDGLLVTNFKAFGNSQNKVPLRPLTIVFGPNSSGKSSLLHSQLFTHHNLTSGEGNIRQPILAGESVDLGGFEQLCFKHKVELGPIVTLSLKGTALRSLFQSNEALKPVLISMLFADPTYESLAEQYSRDLDEQSTYLAPLNLQPNPWLRMFTCFVEEKMIFQFGRTRGGELRVYQTDLDHPFFKRTIDSIANSLRISTTETSAELKAAVRSVLNKALTQAVVEEEQYLPRSFFLDRSLYTEDAFADHAEFTADECKQLPAALAGGLKSFSNLLGNLHGKIKAYYSSLEYLGPLRSYPERYFSFSAQRDANWKAGGGFAWDVLRENNEIREMVNQWLGDPEKLNTPYRIGIRRYIDPKTGLEDLEEVLWDIPNSLIDELKNARLEEMEETIEQTTYVDVRQKAEEASSRLINSTKVAGVNNLEMLDLRTRTVVSHRDVGIGISQVLPVLVTAMASHHKTLMIEQPEIHIHPKLQAELGDVFINSALGDSQNNLILETHSEHLILRLLRRIRESTEGSSEYPEGLPRIRPDDISVLYVVPGPEGSVIRELRVTPDGDFADNWPEGFFTEREKELF